MIFMMTRSIFAFLFTLLLFASPVATASQFVDVGQRVRLNGLDVTVWGKSNPPVKKPVLFFSHGFHGCATQSRFLMEELAKSGYIVFAPNHHDATCSGGSQRWIDRAQKSFRRPETWDENTFHDRAEDFNKLIEAIKTDKRFRSQVDWQHFGLIGHSLGGYTVLALGGAWKSWKLSGVKAVLALSPYSNPFVRGHTLEGITVPVMYQGVTRDLGVTPTVHKSMGAYDQTPAPKYYIEFKGAGHFVWTDMTSQSHDSITAYSLAFLNHYVRGFSASRDLTALRNDVAVLRYDSELGRFAGDEEKQ